MSRPIQLRQFMWHSATKRKPFAGWNARSMSIPRQCFTWRAIPYFVHSAPIHVSRIFYGGWVWIRRKRLPDKINREPEEIPDRAKATQRLQGCDRLCSPCMAAHADREPDFSVFRNSELGGTSCGVVAHHRISRGADSCLGV